MTKDNLRHVQSCFRKVYPNKALIYRLDNNFVVDERLQFVHDDQEHELIYFVERNDNPTTGRDRPFRLVSQDYDQIQDVSVELTEDEIITVTEACGYTHNQAVQIKQRLTYTMEDFADSINNHAKNRRDIIG